MALAVVVLGAALLVGESVRQELGWVDAVSGSRKDLRVWRFVAPSPAVVTESPLAKKYRELGLKWEPDWKQVRATEVDIFGRSISNACGMAPEIYTLNADLQRLFLKAASDDEVRAFFRVMSGGSDAEKKAAVEGECEKGLGAYESALSAE
jgi:hypothetical protein